MEKDSHGAHQLVIPKERRIAVLEGVHDNLGIGDSTRRVQF